MDSERIVRSFLYVPGDRPDRIVKAMAAGADAVLIDLEDAVAPSSKQAARTQVVEAVSAAVAQPTALWVRINSVDSGLTDLDALLPVLGLLDGIVMAKCDTAAWVDEVAGRTPDTLRLSPLVESALAVRNLDELCGHPRVRQCQLGEIDLLADLGGHPRGADALIGFARTQLVYASAAAGILAPIGGVDPDVRNLDGLAASSAHLVAIGFGGRAAIHPGQVAVINTAFTPSDLELATAQEFVGRYEASLREGVGAVVAADGSMVDEAVVRRARQLLARNRE